MHKRTYSHYEYSGLWKVKAHVDTMYREFRKVSPKIKKHYFHNLDTWFDTNDNYYYYKAKDFPKVYALLQSIQCIDEDTAIFSVIDGPLVIPPHRAESNTQLRYHLTLESGKDCVLETEYGKHVHLAGKEFLFDHARYHALEKYGDARRVTLILDIRRY